MTYLKNKLQIKLIDLSKSVKIFLVLTADIVTIIIATLLSYMLRLGEYVPLDSWGEYRPMIPLSVSLILAIPIFIRFNLYKEIFRYTGWPSVLTMLGAMFWFSVVFVFLFGVMSIEGTPRSVGFIQPILVMMGLCVTRGGASYFLSNTYRTRISNQNTQYCLIYGANYLGIDAAQGLSKQNKFHIVGYVDDSPHLIGRTLHGKNIYPASEIEDLCKLFRVSLILLACPNMNSTNFQALKDKVEALDVRIQVVPSFLDLASGMIKIKKLRSIEINDLLDRAPISSNNDLNSINLKDKVVLITGAGGSIGSQLCIQVLENSPKAIILIDHSEYALYAIHEELLKCCRGKELKIYAILGSVADPDFIDSVFDRFKPNTIFHAAAYKHVPLMEENVIEGIKNNVFGVLETAKCAVKFQSESFTLISTDKAVRPTNVMGATKRVSELILQAFAFKSSKTKFSMVRFGNVLGSSGSVTNKFIEQIEVGGPITVTHYEVTRYFMSIAEAVLLVLRSNSMALGGEVFILDMGQPVKIYDLATKMVALSGLSLKDEKNPNGDIGIICTGLRPGEKLYEELLIDCDAAPTQHKKILLAQEPFIAKAILDPKLQELKSAISARNIDLAIEILESLVDGFRRSLHFDNQMG